MTQDEIIEIDEARNIAVKFGTRMCDEHGDAHGEELYCVGIDDIRDIIKLVAAKEREDIARIDWHNLLREDGWVTNGQASAYSEKIEAAISARGEA